MSILRNNTNRHVIWGVALITGYSGFFFSHLQQENNIRSTEGRKRKFNLFQNEFSQSYCASWYYQSFFYSPTDAQ